MTPEAKPRGAVARVALLLCAALGCACHSSTPRKEDVPRPIALCSGSWPLKVGPNSRVTCTTPEACTDPKGAARSSVCSDPRCNKGGSCVKGGQCGGRVDETTAKVNPKGCKVTEKPCGEGLVECVCEFDVDNVPGSTQEPQCECACL
jgi:hypothetical protein